MARKWKSRGKLWYVFLCLSFHLIYEREEVTDYTQCFRAVTSSGRPIVSRIPDQKLGGGFKTRPGAEGGVFMAAGHGAWGISQAPGTGLCMAELVEGRQTSANITALTLP